MMTAVKIPNLPEGDIKLAVCGDHPVVLKALEERGVEVITISSSELLPNPVANHADMLCCHAAENKLVTCDDSLISTLASYGINGIMTSASPSDHYPYDCILNCLVLDDVAVGRVDSLDRILLDNLECSGKRIIDVRQGYTRCSVAVADRRSVITADRGIASSLITAGFDVLLITPGHIILEGYDTGFIGGCCGKLSADRMLFYGDILTHPDGQRIVSFLAERGICAECIHSGTLTDFGGFIPLCE